MARIKPVENYPLASRTTFRVGGPARYFIPVRSEATLLLALEFAQRRGLPVFVLGGGSNVLVSDDGFDGVVIHNRIKGITNRTEGEYAFISAGSGESWQEFVDWCVSANLQGLECLAGIPGTVGASPVQNIGAYGQEVSKTIREVRAVEAATGKTVVFGGEACGFGYRASAFNSTSNGEYCITGVAFRLRRNGKPCLAHMEIAGLLEYCSNPTVGQVSDSVIAVRSGKGLLVRKGHERFRCAGSFFMNPVLNAEEVGEIMERMRQSGARAHWFRPTGSGHVKISAAGLIQAAGFGQGYRKGKVGLSPRHALIIIAHRGATARDTIEFAEEVQGKVKEKFGILLKPEIKLVGFPTSCLAG